MSQQPNLPPSADNNQSAPYKRLIRYPGDGMVGGVCAALARYFNIDPTLARVLALIAMLLTFPIGPIVYAVMWAIIPKQ